MPDSSPELFCAVPVTMVEDGAGMVCTRRTDGEVFPLNSSQASTLRYVVDIQPFAEHVAALSERDIGLFVQRIANRFRMSATIGRRFANTLKEWRKSGSLKTYGGLSTKYARGLMELRSKGLLLSDRDLVVRLQDEKEADPEVRIRSLGVPTANRPERLAVCLQSFISNLEKHQREDAAIFVLADSEDPNNKQVVEQACASSRVRVQHLGSDHRTALIENLVKHTAVPREVIEFGLVLPKVLKTEMPARNAFLLATVGDYIFHADDDTRCAYASASSDPGATVISCSSDPCEGWFYPDYESILRERPLDKDFDILGAHEDLLGKSVASAVRRAPRIGWKHLTPESLLSIYNGPGHIGVTSTGCAGDSGLYASGSYLFASTDETFARMCQSPQTYDIAIHSGKVVRVPVTKVVSRADYFQGMSYALDNTQLQPPYFPMGRNADGVTAFLYLLSDSQSWIGHLPWAIYHQSDAGRKSYFAEHIEQFSRLRLCDILIYSLKSATPPSPATRSRALPFIGEQLIALGSLPPGSFKSYLRGEFAKVQTSLLKFLDEKLTANAGKYSFWEKDVRTMAASLKRSIAEENSIVPADVEAQVGAASALEFAQQSLKLYGRLLCGWEELTQAARNIRQPAA